MKLKNIVENYAHKGKQGLEIDLEALALNKEFNAEAVKKVMEFVPVGTCVFIPGYDEKAKNAHFSELIEKLSQELRKEAKAYVTSNIENVKQICGAAKEIIIIKQSFRTGNTLGSQIAEIKAAGCDKISVLCIITNSTSRLQGFAVEMGVKVKALVKTDEIEYIPG